MGFDLKPLWESFSTQVIILLCIVGVALLIGTIVTQGFARGIMGVILIFVLVMLIIMLNDVESIGGKLKDLIIKEPAGIIYPFKSGFWRF